MPKKVKLTFKYQLPPALRGKDDIPKSQIKKYPLVPITLYSPSGSVEIEGLVDSGADTLHIPKGIAEMLGLELGGSTESYGAGGSYKSYVAKVGLKIGRGKGGRVYDFGYVEACTPSVDTDTPVLLGRDPVFKEYDITFEEKKEKIKMKPND